MRQISNSDYDTLLRILKGVIFGFNNPIAIANHKRIARALYKKLVRGK